MTGCPVLSLIMLCPEVVGLPTEEEYRALGILRDQNPPKSLWV